MKNHYLNFITVFFMVIGASHMMAQATGQSCTDAIPISEGIQTAEAIYSGEMNNGCFADGGENGLWYLYTPTESGIVTISSSIDLDTPDTRLSVFTGNCGLLFCAGFDDDAGEGFTSLLNTEVTLGEPLYLQWDDRWDSGEFDFIVTFDEMVIDVYGCTDPEAENYNPNATIDNGSCFYPFECDAGIAAQLYICVFSNGNQVYFDLSGSNGIEIFNQDGFSDGQIMNTDICLEEDVCYTVTMENNTGPFGWYQGYYWINVDGNTVSTGMLNDGEQSASLIFSIDGTCGEVYGCTDPEAENYNPEATVDNGSCIYFIANDACEDATELEAGSFIAVNNVGAESDGLYGECWGFGSGDEEQNGVWYTFTTPADPAVIIIEAIADISYTLMDTQFGLFAECGGEMIACDGNSGEGLLSKFEFECGDLETSTQYYLLVDGWAGQQGTCMLSYEVADGCSSIEGCTDPEALNYDANATIDDGSCIYPLDCDFNEVTVQFEVGQWFGEVSWVILSSSTSEVYAEGGVNDGDPQLICLPDGCYQLVMIDAFGDGWNGNVISVYLGDDLLLETTLEDGSEGIAYFGVNSECEDLEVSGCTDPIALNFNPFATIDDGSCEYFQVEECQASFEILSVDQDQDVMYLLNTSTFGWGYEYYWDFGDGTSTTAPLPLHEYAEDGTYTICLTIFGPNCEDEFCMDITYEGGGAANAGGSDGVVNGGFTINVVDEITGVNELSQTITTVNVYPNPASSIINISYDLKEGVDVTLSVISMTGERLLTKDYRQSAGFNSELVSVSELASGMYMLEINMDGDIQYQRFSVMK